jgi:hypothetical protein
MSIVTMNMSQYEVERHDSEASEYGDEVLCAGWNPALGLQQYAYATGKQATAMPHELASVDVESFLKKMYAYQR